VSPKTLIRSLLFFLVGICLVLIMVAVIQCNLNPIHHIVLVCDMEIRKVI